MTPERHARIKEIFLAACERPPERRAAFLDAACGDDDELRAQVEELLEHHGKDDRTVAVQPLETGAPADHVSDSSGPIPDIEGDRFESGTVIADRYRIVALLGKGGMGEVYRADDLILDQAIALKFLPPDVARSPLWLERFLNEVRIARKVTHPNVCRVFDIGHAAENAFISMEYVDGEDLHSLLKRIGRLAPDKALDIARQICQGVAAAHAKGVLHRDLKPANIMLDGEGQVRITDFGLAAMRGQIKAGEIRAGTPAYMAPELFAGTDVSVRSDLYALGLVLYELFTGRPVHQAESYTEYARLHQRSQPKPPSSLVSDIDPAVERLILRCLEKDPGHRPSSVLVVAAALPGSDALATAVAAGATPPPELVAAAGGSARLRPPLAIGLLAGVVGLLVVVALLSERTGVVPRLHLAKPPPVLAETARQIVGGLGYASEPRNEAYAFAHRVPGALREVASWGPGSGPESHAVGSEDGVYFWYRSGAEQLAPAAPLNITFGEARVTLTDPPATRSEAASVLLDPTGGLLWLEAVRPRLIEAENHRSPVDWSTLLTAAGLDPGALRPTEPELTPRIWWDTRAAWTGSLPGQDSRGVRVEAAALEGNPVFFVVLREAVAPEASASFADVAWRTAVSLNSRIVLLSVVVLGALPLAHLNLKRGRSDRRGATGLAAFTFVARLVVWSLQAAHALDLATELGLFLFAVLGALLEACIVWLLYVAAEPSVRRFWPQTLVSWSRVLAGQPRDPLVGRDILIGVLLGVFWGLVANMDRLVVDWLGLPAREPLRLFGTLTPLLGSRLTLASCIRSLQLALYWGLLILVLLVLMRMLLRRSWMAVVAAVIVLVPAYLPLTTNPAVSWALVVLLLVVGLWVMVRFGLVALVAGVFVNRLLMLLPVTLDPRTWFWDSSLLVLLITAGVAVYGFSSACRRGTQPEALHVAAAP